MCTVHVHVCVIITCYVLFILDWNCWWWNELCWPATSRVMSIEISDFLFYQLFIWPSLSNIYYKAGNFQGTKLVQVFMKKAIIFNTVCERFISRCAVIANCLGFT